MGRRGEVSLSDTPQSESLPEGSKDKTSIRHALMQRPWRNVAFWLALCGWPSLLLYTAHRHRLRGGSVHNRPDPPTTLRVKKMSLLLLG